MVQTSIYDFKALDIHKKEFDFGQLRGKVVLVVNVASLCGFTVQYKDLEYLYEKYKDQGFIVLGFPCNQFGRQEPFSETEIMDQCQRNYGVSFPIMDKVEVNGEMQHPLYAYLKSKQTNALGFHGVKWNFEKFLIDREGEVVNRYESSVGPLRFAVTIEKLLE